MNIRSLVKTIRSDIVAAALATAGVLSGNGPAHAAWESAHGNGANTGFALVDTLPAARAMKSVELGAVAPGANPVVAPDGTVYIGTMDGKLKAFHPHGALYWERTINSYHGGIYSAPVVSADGSIYVVSSQSRGDSTLRSDSYLHKFLPGGGWLGGQPFPFHGGDSGATSAPPNIWRHNGQEAIIVPAKFRTNNGVERRLIAFSTDTNVMSDVLVGFESFGDIGGGGGVWKNNWSIGGCLALNWWNLTLGCMLFNPPGFDGPSGGPNPPPPSSVDKAGYPMASVAIVAPRQAGAAPTIVVTDEDYVVGYSFSMTAGLSVIHTYDYNRGLATPPITMPDGTTVVGSLDGHVFYEKGGSYLGFSGRFGYLTAAPTRLFGGGLAVVSRGGGLTVLDSSKQVIYQRPLTGGQSMASAAASCTHLYVNTLDELATFDVKTMLGSALIRWPSIMDGGLHAPVIGPTGHVYVIARLQDTVDTMYVFPRPENGGVPTARGCTTG